MSDSLWDLLLIAVGMLGGYLAHDKAAGRFAAARGQTRVVSYRPAHRAPKPRPLPTSGDLSDGR